MKLQTLVLYVVVYAFSHATLAADPPAKSQAASDTVAAKRSLEIYGVSSLHARDMVLKAAAEHAGLIGVAPNRVGNYVAMNLRSGRPLGGRRIDAAAPEGLEVVVDVSGDIAAKPRAAEYIDAIVASLEKQLQDFRGGRTETAKRNLDEVERRIQQADAKGAAIEANIRDVTDRVDASIEPIRAAVPKLEEERQSLKLQVVGKLARQEALAEAIERHAKGAETQLKGDEVMAQLEKIAKVRITRLELVRKLFQSGDAPQAAVHDAETAEAEARMRILERQEVVKQSAGGGEVLSALNRELAMLSIDVAEAQAKLSAIEKLLGKYATAQPLLAEAERLRRERDRLEKSRDNAEAGLRDAQATTSEPVLRVLDSDATPAP